MKLLSVQEMSKESIECQFYNIRELKAIGE